MEPQVQPVIPLGFPANQPAGSSDYRIDVQVPLYVTLLNSLFVTVPHHFMVLRSATYPLSPEQNRARLISSFSRVAWAQLGPFLTHVYEKKKRTLTGQPDEQAWQKELELMRLAHIRIYKGD